VLVRPNSRITSPQNLENTTIGTAEPQLPQLMPDNPSSPPYSLETVAASSVLENDGVRLAKVQFKPMPEDQLIGALRSGAVDAILVTEPQIYQAESQIGARSVLDACSGETVNLPLDGYFAPASYAKQHQDALNAFHGALMRAQASANQPAPLNNALTHYAGMSRETASLITVGTYPTSLRVSSLQRGRGPDVVLRYARAPAQRLEHDLPVALGHSAWWAAWMAARAAVRRACAAALSMPSPLRTPSLSSRSSKASRMCSVPM